MASLFARCTPGSYDTLETAAKGMTHAQLACALLGTCGWQGSGYLAGVAAMSCLGLVAMETGTRALLKYTAASCWFTLWLDIIWMASYATDNINKNNGWNSGHLRGNELCVGMIVLIFMLRFPQFFVWQKLWHLGFKTSGGAGAQPSRYVDFATNPVARGQEMGSPTPQGDAFAQPPRATPSSALATAPMSPSPAPPAPVVSAPSPPAPISAPAVVSFTPSGPGNV